jgi:putative phosphoribosyl transferase
MAETELQIADRVRRYRRGRPARDVTGKTVIVVDDGVATGSTTRAALRALRRRGPALIVLAVPVGAGSTLRALADEADQVVCPHPAEDFQAVGHWYRDFEKVTEDEVVAVLDRSWADDPALPATVVMASDMHAARWQR